MNKENFEFPKAEVEEIETKDIITLSDNDIEWKPGWSSGTSGNYSLRH